MQNKEHLFTKFTENNILLENAHQKGYFLTSIVAKMQHKQYLVEKNATQALFCCKG
jgi:hypothetical protein